MPAPARASAAVPQQEAYDIGLDAHLHVTLRLCGQQRSALDGTQLPPPVLRLP
ncbi:MAG: hypothetical protein ACLQIQ_05830 [Beijerinckiaceae bacterium]